MKAYRFLVLALMLCLLLPLLFACGEPDNEPVNPTDTALTNLSEYKLIYPYQPDDAVWTAFMELRDAIQEETGVRLKHDDDFVNEKLGQTVPVGTLEILVGITTRPESKTNVLGKDDIDIHFENNRLVITGGSAESTVLALEYFMEHYLHDGALYVPGEAYLYHADYPYDNATIGTTPIHKYSIVYTSDTKPLAVHLQNSIANATGMILPLRSVKDDVTDYEILLGDFTGVRATTAAPAGKYRVESVGTRLSLRGDGKDGAYAAMMAFLGDISGSGDTLALNYATAKTGNVKSMAFFSLNIPDTLASFEGTYDVNYNTDTVMARFLAAVEELPTEITVVERVSTDTYPLSLTNQVYVSPNGDDKAAGTLEAPLATLQAAINKMNGKSGGIIWMMGGTYSVDATVTIGSQHSGGRQSPLFIKAYGGADVTITSQIPLDTSDGKWNYVDIEDPLHVGIADRMPEDALEYVIYTTLEAQGMTEADIPKITKNGPGRLYVGDTEYTLARYPNADSTIHDLLYFTVPIDTGKVTSRDGSDLYWAWIARAAANGWNANAERGWEIRVLNAKDNSTAKDHPDAADMGEEILSWVNTGNIWYYGSTFEGWEFGYYNLALTTTEEDGTKHWAHTADGRKWNPSMDETPYLGTPDGNGYYTLKSMTYNSWGCKNSGNSAAGRNTFFLFNAIEALDAPGEWYYEEETGVLYLYPEEEHADLETSVPSFSSSKSFNLVSVQNAQNIVFDGIKFSGSTNNGLYVSACTGVVVQNCIFTNTTGSNLSLVNSSESAVLYCDFSQSYTTSMLNTSNSGSFYAMTPTNNIIQNNVFHNPSPYRQVGVACGGVRTIISHNYFNNTTCNGSSAAECVIEYNLFEGGSKDITDGGMCYFGGSSSRTNHFRYNLFHMFNATHNAVYNDTMGGGNYMYYNVVSTLHSTSDHNKPWYSSTGWANVSYGNVTVLRTPAELRDAGSNATVESNGYAKATQGDVFNESALFYYHFGEEYSGGGTKGRYIPYDYEGNKQYPVISDGNGGYVYNKTFANANYVDYVTKEVGPCLTQSLAGHWWDGIKTSDVNTYLGFSGKVDVEAWCARAPEHMNMLWGTKLILDLKDAVTQGTEDYHIKYFYIPWYLTYDEDGTRKTFTDTEIPEGVVIEIPEYSYLVEEDGAIDLVTVPAHVAERDEDGNYTLTYEEIAAMERARRAPQYSIVMNNIILGSSPVFTTVKGNQYPTNESSPADVVTDGTKSYHGYVATTVVKNNFMTFDYSDIMPGAYLFEYDITEEGWDLIEDTTNPAATVEPKVIPILKRLMTNIYGWNGGLTVGPTYDGFYASSYFDDVYDDFDWEREDYFYWLEEIK